MSSRYVWKRFGLAYSEESKDCPLELPQTYENYYLYWSKEYKQTPGGYTLVSPTEGRVVVGTTYGTDAMTPTYFMLSSTRIVGEVSGTTMYAVPQSNNNYRSYSLVCGKLGGGGSGGDIAIVVGEFYPDTIICAYLYRHDIFTVAKAGGALGSSTSSEINAYPEDGIRGSYWYTYQGEDSIDPMALSYSTASPKGGQDITLDVTPRSNTYGGTITYRYEISTDGGNSWSPLSTTTGTSVAYTIPKGVKQFCARVLASDDCGFTSLDYVTGANLTVANNTAPSAPASITVPAYVKGGGTLAISWDAAADVDGNLSGYKLERSYNGGSWSQIYQGNDASYTDNITYGWATVQYRVKSYDADGDESGYTTSEARAVTNTVAPAAPGSITVPVSPVAGTQIAITWTESTDADGDLAGYKLDRKLDDGAWTTVYTGTGLSYVDAFSKGYSTVSYRVAAYDSEAQYSGYTTSAARTIINNNAPVITCDLSGDLGTKDAGFTVPYIITDADGDAVTVTEAVGDLVKRIYTATLGKEQNFHVEDQDGDYFFMRILNGPQTVKITATDANGMSAMLELPFTKAVHAASVTLAQPLTVEEAITVAIISVMADIPDDANYTLEATNNANDDVPVWQDIKADVEARRNIVFVNQVQANGPAFNFRLAVSRGPSNTGGYIQSLRGAFQ